MALPSTLLATAISGTGT